jgi:hypothetical protein
MCPRKEEPSIHSSESCQHEGEAPGGSRRPPQVLKLPKRWLRPCPSRHDWPCVVNHGGVPEPRLEFVKSFVLSTFDGDVSYLVLL